jgi:MFS family permease
MDQIARPQDIRPLDRKDARTLMLAALGGALEFYDFVVFVFFTKVLGDLFFPHGTASWLAQLQLYGIFAAGYVVRPLGGIVMAHFGDRTGRKKMFTLSVLLMALPTLGIGLLPIYAQVGMLAPLLLLLLRVVQGIAVGGEVPGAWVFVAEHVPARSVGFACASLTAGLTFGILLGSLLATALNTSLGDAPMHAWGWRVPFVLGGAFGFLAVWLRRWLSETPVFVEMRERKALSRRLPLWVVMAEHRGGMLVSMLVTWMLTAAIVVLILLLPALASHSFHIDPHRAFLGNSLAALTLCAGCLFHGWLCDRLGAARALLTGSFAMLLITWALFTDMAAGGANFLWLYALTGFFVGVVGVVPTVMVLAFPPAVRFTGISFSYNVAYAVFGASSASLIGLLADRAGPMAPAYYVAFTALLSIGVALYLLRTPSMLTAPSQL